MYIFNEIKPSLKIKDQYEQSFGAKVAFDQIIFSSYKI